MRTSSHYTEADVEKLYRGFSRNLSEPFRFVCFSEKERSYSEPIEQKLLQDELPQYGAMIEPFKLNEPMIIVGLDTVITGNCDHLARYCLTADRIAVPRDPFYPDKLCNGVVLAPAGSAWFWNDKPDGMNDMDWVRSHDLAVIDDLFPGQVVSFKRHVRKQGLNDDMRVVFFHGELKPHELLHIGWIDRHWSGDGERSPAPRECLAAESPGVDLARA